MSVVCRVHLSLVARAAEPGINERSQIRKGEVEIRVWLDTDNFVGTVNSLF